MNCPHLLDGCCQYNNEQHCNRAQQLFSHEIGPEEPLNRPILTTLEACQACIQTSKPQDFNEVTASLATAHISKFQPNLSSHIPKFVKYMHAYLTQYKTAVLNGKGPGTSLHHLLSSFGIQTPDGCSCWQLAHEMNEWGPEGCRKNIQVIVDRMKENSQFLGMISKYIQARGFMGKLTDFILRCLIAEAIAEYQYY